MHQQILYEISCRVACFVHGRIQIMWKLPFQTVKLS